MNMQRWKKNHPAARITQEILEKEESINFEAILAGKTGGLWRCYTEIIKNRYDDKDIDDDEKVFCEHCKRNFKGPAGMSIHWAKQKARLDKVEDSDKEHELCCLEIVAKDEGVSSDIEGEDGDIALADADGDVNMGDAENDINMGGRKNAPG